MSNLISTDIIELVDEIQEQQIIFSSGVKNEDSDLSGSFKVWAQTIANRCKTDLQITVGEIDNAQYFPELESFVINPMKYFPCWSGIMKPIFGFGELVASSSRIESNFNHLKNRVFINESMSLRVDSFLEKILAYYRGDHLLYGEILNNSYNNRAIGSTNTVN